MKAVAHILEHQLISIVRGATPADILRIGEALYNGGIRTVEITLNSPGALVSIEILSRQMADRMLVGAGTVLDAQSAMAAIDAGARFIISPITNLGCIKATKERSAVSIPGACTPTEMYNAHAAGGDIIKVFPASAGPAFIKEVLAPLPFLPLMPTGGVSLENIRAFKKSGAIAFGLGKALFDAGRALSDTYLHEIGLKAREFVEAVNGK